MVSIGLAGFNNLEKFGLSSLIRNYYPAADIRNLGEGDVLFGVHGVVLSEGVLPRWTVRLAGCLSVLVFSDDPDSDCFDRNLTKLHNLGDSRELDFQICEWLTAVANRVEFEVENKYELRTRCSFSSRENQVMTLLSGGASNDQIAAILGITAPTVKTYLRRIYGKLGASNRAHAVSLFRDFVGAENGNVALPHRGE
ncbi:MAG: helix-turn-helix transcriptional regulator [Acidovorax sp.]|nr:helix-turn-helix transcriptional regulator [Acidovorax sp.]